ncbi:NAD-dependent deacylase [Gordonia desulfuricans]|uniref:NAD-dependent protein deacylase n=1 Tax=Gordonia desulfuricans TaxID=89051 RepID=A0A7K3LN02_9ACTN|nr:MULTISPECIES: NAD-dependent deacylase [Gordonia]EMP12833.1 NAD-dependent deacetylase [Gordonia sp. NB41Y]NDK89563.1 NAD-dependent deacylase [Gordonia desulfuricans]WLP91355.1 NAD-dependent deacylase [Gordonia sp. NB41Y]
MTTGTPTIPDEVVATVADAGWITVFSGAGMSADSGVPTFRDAQTGLWENFDPATIASPEAWDADPALVWGWYHWRAHLVRDARPNAGHLALAELSSVGAGDDERALMVVTQNVDDLHERAGTPVLSHLHGSLFAPRCSVCDTPYDGPDADSAVEPEGSKHDPRLTPPTCAVCGGAVRPGIVWFGEHLPADAWERAENAFRGADVVLVVGTSGIVYPAASLPERAAASGVPVIEINPEPSALTEVATHSIRAGAATALPALVDAIRRRG